MKRSVFLWALLAAAPAFSADRTLLPSTMTPPPARPGEASSLEPPRPELTQAAPIPAPRPDIAPLGYAPSLPPAQDTIARTVPPDLRAPKGLLPVDEVACRTELKKLGAKFEDADPQAGPEGCSMPFPVSMSEIGGGVKIEPPVTTNCATALASARFTAATIQKAARDVLNSEVKSISQASGYVCRPRNGTAKLSEHAFGNALDIAAFTLADGTVVNVQPALPALQQRFLTEVRNAACGPFKTVLGPGSNADHERHLHFDLAQRRNGGTYCR